MKLSLLFVALTAATPTFAQNPIASALVNVLAIEAPVPTTWEFAPDFLRDQSRISWSAPNASGAGEFFATTTNGAGILTGEVVNLLNASNRNCGTVTATFDKKGKLKDQVMSGFWARCRWATRTQKPKSHSAISRFRPMPKKVCSPNAHLRSNFPL